FCPAFAVISRCTSFTKASNSGVPGAASGPRMEALSESCSAMKRVAFWTRLRFMRSMAAVSAEPVKETTSWPESWSSRSPVPPTTNCTAPSGTSPDSTIMRKQASATHAVAEAGLTMAGMPASRVAEKVSRTADSHLLRAFRYEPGVHDHAEAGFCHPCRGRGRLDDGRHAGKQRRRQLFQHAPDGKVEGVYMDGHAPERGRHMLADEAAGARKLLHRPLDQDRVVRQLPPPLRGRT